MTMLKEKYLKVMPAMQEKFGYKNPMAIPVEQIVINMGAKQPKISKLRRAADDLTRISDRSR